MSPEEREDLSAHLESTSKLINDFCSFLEEKYGILLHEQEEILQQDISSILLESDNLYSDLNFQQQMPENFDVQYDPFDELPAPQSVRNYRTVEFHKENRN